METTTTEPEDKPFLDFDNPKILFGFVGGAIVLALLIIGALSCACCSNTSNRRRRRRPLAANQAVILPMAVTKTNEAGTVHVLTIDRPKNKNHPPKKPGRRKVQRPGARMEALANKRPAKGNKYLDFEVPSPEAAQKPEPIGVDPRLEEMAKYMVRKVAHVLQSITIESERIEKQAQIGSGRFGVVNKGILLSADKKQKRAVALKTLASDVEDEQGMQQFVDEVMKMTNFKHPNVMQILGLAIMDGKLHIVLPFMEKGDLKTYVSSNKKRFEVNDLLKMAVQVTKGMDYLGKQNLIHGDLAARNCMVNEKLVVKVADFGLSRHLYQSEYYSSKEPSQCPRPVRWMAIECIVENKYTIKSDVWSFGILLWELMTRGERPYYEISSNAEVIFRVKNGYRLSRPKNCKEEIYRIMTSCWDENPHNRPNFVDIQKWIELITGGTDQEYLAPKTE